MSVNVGNSKDAKQEGQETNFAETKQNFHPADQSSVNGTSLDEMTSELDVRITCLSRSRDNCYPALLTSG